MINNLGNNLNIVIQTTFDYFGDWTAFACWYSVSKMLPDANVSLFYPHVSMKEQVLGWMHRCRVPLFKSKVLPENTMILDHCTIVARELNDKNVELLNNNLLDDMLSEAKDEKITPFVSYRNGCGNFVASDWINTKECPFSIADKFMIHTATANEIKVLKLWKQLSIIYASISRS